MNTHEIHCELENYGFELQDTEDALKAYVRIVPGLGLAEVIMLAGDPALDDVCRVSTVTDDEADAAPSKATVREILAALHDPREDHFLLELRLRMGYGRDKRGRRAS
jgi:hypothetical protein